MLLIEVDGKALFAAHKIVVPAGTISPRRWFQSSR